MKTKIIIDFENYTISKNGEIFNIKTNKKLKPIMCGNGYTKVYLYNNDKRKMCLIHRLVANAFISNIKNKPQVNHINGIKHDNRVENLEWATPKENSIHSWNTGLKTVTDKQLQSLRKRCNKLVLDTQTGIFYENATEAATLLGIKKSTLHCYLNKSRINKTSLQYV